MLFRRPFETTAMAEDVFKALAAYFNDKDMEWEILWISALMAPQ